MLSYLAQLGISGADAERRCAEAVAFAELEEYIGQPVKTYSTGMAMRLMFATSTVLSPDILVLDEVLGVGDAYFAQKSFERMHELCSGAGTTLVLVTHDVYSAMKLCTRFIWLDRGRILMDGTSRDVVDAYELSIRAQEEHRLRLKRMAAAARERKDGIPPLYGQVQLEGQDPPDGCVAIAGMRIMSGSAELARLSMDAPGDGLQLELKPGDGNWGDLVQLHGRTARCFLPHGSIFHRLPFLVSSPEAAAAIRQGAARVELTMWSDPGAAARLEVVINDPDGRRTFGGRFDAGDDPGWREIGAALEKGGVEPAASRRAGLARYGSRALEIVDVRFYDADGGETLQFAVGSTLRAAVDYRINDPDFDERPTLIVAFQKDGVTRAHRFWTDGIAFRAAQRREGTVEVVAEPLLLGAGTYIVTVSVYREGYFDSSARLRFFSANPGVLDKHSRGYEIVVRPSARTLCNDVVFQHASAWYADGRRVAETAIVREA